MTKPTKIILTGVMIVAVVIAGWAFFRDQRQESLMPPTPAQVQTNPPSGEAVMVSQENDIEAVDNELKMLEEDNSAIDDNLPAAKEPPVLQAIQ